MDYPASELEYWSAFFSIDEGGHKSNESIRLKEQQNSVTVEESQHNLMRVLGNG